MTAEQSSARQLEHFRATKRRLPLHPLEKAVLVTVAIHLCFLPWALGTMHAWSQLTSLGLSTLGFVLALLPRTYSGDLAPPLSALSPQPAGMARQSSGFRSQPSGFHINPLPRLLKFPLFWIGLMLLAYIAVQGCNPSWVWTRNATTWWLVRVNDIPWLPTSIDSPFERFNLWRQFIIYASAWLTVCTLWIGITRRRSLQLLLTILVVNAALLAIVGFAHRILSPASFFGLFDWPSGHSAFASFIYKNHAGAYFALVTSLTIAVALWTHDNGARGGRKSTPASLLIFVALLFSAAVLSSHSRGATLTVAAFLAIIGLWMFLRRWALPVGPGGNSVVTTLVVLAFAATLLGTSRYLDFSAISDRFTVLAKDPAGTMEGRRQAYDSAQVMLADHGLRGIGSGGFRYLFPEYIKKYPSAYQGGQFFWDHAHRDWLEIPIELGAVGTLLLAGGFGWFVVFFLTHGRHRPPPSDFKPQVSAFRSQVSSFRSPTSPLWHSLAIPILIGCSQTLAHAWFDFPFQNPAILITWLALLVISARWLELDAPQ